MPIKELKPGVYSVGAVHPDRRLFDEIIPLPDGTSYNSYLIKGENKTALIDAVDPTKQDVLISNLRKLGVKEIHYIISNHAEQDHSGGIPLVLKEYPEAKVVTNMKCKEMLKELLLIQEDRFTVIGDGDTLSLGGKNLKFIIAPWVHWPETMLTYLIEDSILFSCDLFGSHLASDDYSTSFEADKLLKAAKRYYAEIMMPFRQHIKKHMEALKKIKIEMIAPSHGPIYVKPDLILNAYKEWISDNVKNIVVLPYVSMHGSTLKIVEYLTKALQQRRIEVKPHNLTSTDIGELAMDLVDAATVVLGSPAMLVGAHPSAFYAAYLINILRPKTKYISIIGSYGWGSRVVEQIEGLFTSIKPELIEPVIVKGYPKKDDFEKIDQLADQILTKHRELNLL
ncbi:MAG: FprA family A-type flavoprotein [Candidatus Odinarchaeum yellowstonii]|jgi:flavorubredoxin|uniref:FprA family A-type flavoprotein n=1 Tax=Odinarchaeota yellowstonii (strain LCB_4) TaxID=1841599 RepID=A0AAF0D199_ODILC|nr:MAG: FprA family A-type flavoprotein [Candidatus Odinarchaeum yellowstonii]